MLKGRNLLKAIGGKYFFLLYAIRPVRLLKFKLHRVNKIIGVFIFIYLCIYNSFIRIGRGIYVNRDYRSLVCRKFHKIIIEIQRALRYRTGCSFGFGFESEYIIFRKFHIRTIKGQSLFDRYGIYCGRFELFRNKYRHVTICFEPAFNLRRYFEILFRICKTGMAEVYLYSAVNGNIA